MKMKPYPECIRSALYQSINKVAADLNACVKMPERDFLRKRKLPLKTMLLMLVGIGGGNLTKELYDWFGYLTNTATVSAFVQQRDRNRPEVLEMSFKHFVDSTTLTTTFQGYRLLAVDGSDLRLPSNPADDFSLIRNNEGHKQSVSSCLTEIMKRYTPISTRICFQLKRSRKSIISDRVLKHLLESLNMLLD